MPFDGVASFKGDVVGFKADLGAVERTIYAAFKLPPEYFVTASKARVNVPSKWFEAISREATEVYMGVVEEGSLLSLMTDPAFVTACKAAGVEPTKRQASKYRNKRGQAYAKRDRSREPFPDYRAPRARDHEEF